MRIVDGHNRMREGAVAAEVLNRMDINGIDRMVVISPNERTSLDRFLEIFD